MPVALAVRSGSAGNSACRSGAHPVHVRPEPVDAGPGASGHLGQPGEELVANRRPVNGEQRKRPRALAFAVQAAEGMARATGRRRATSNGHSLGPNRDARARTRCAIVPAQVAQTGSVTQPEAGLVPAESIRHAGIESAEVEELQRGVADHATAVGVHPEVVLVQVPVRDVHARIAHERCAGNMPGHEIEPALVDEVVVRDIVDAVEPKPRGPPLQ